MPYNNQSKRREYQRTWNPERKREIKSRYRQRLRALIDEAKSAGCALCGESDIRCLDFHHRDPKQKVFNLGQAQEFGRDKILREIEKCDVLCANCHRKLHG